jgi:hypothetical protein
VRDGIVVPAGGVALGEVVDPDGTTGVLGEVVDPDGTGVLGEVVVPEGVTVLAGAFSFGTVYVVGV